MGGYHRFSDNDCLVRPSPYYHNMLNPRYLNTIVTLSHSSIQTFLTSDPSLYMESDGTLSAHHTYLILEVHQQITSNFRHYISIVDQQPINSSVIVAEYILENLEASCDHGTTPYTIGLLSDTFNAPVIHRYSQRQMVQLEYLFSQLSRRSHYPTAASSDVAPSCTSLRFPISIHCNMT